jgi:nuclear cap-binding protein subunit 1
LLGFLTLSPRPASKPAQESDVLDAVEGATVDDVEMGEKSVNFGIMLIKVLVAAFRSDLDARLWRNVRLLLHLFASLLPLGIIESTSLRSILLSFAAVLEEPGVTAVRGDRAAICIIETMCRAGRDLIGTEGEARGVYKNMRPSTGM